MNIDYLFSKEILEIRDRFISYYGEERVDLQWREGYISDAGIAGLQFPDRFISSTFHKDFASPEDDNDDWSTFTIKEYLEKYPDTLINIMDGYDHWKTNSYANILVFFPEVTITNEAGDSTLIKELWVKIPVLWNGHAVGAFGINRSHYTYAHWVNNYLHSHVHSIPKHDFRYFDTPCLGGGPIKDTMLSLAGSPTPYLWDLFCLELDRYVRNESIAGVPYKSLTICSTTANVTKELMHYNGKNLDVRQILPNHFPFLQEFIDYLIVNKKLKFRLVNFTFTLAMSFEELLLTLTDSYIEVVNNITRDWSWDDKKSKGDEIYDSVLIPCEKRNGLFYELRSVSIQMDSNIPLSPKLVCMFKGKPVYLKIDSEDNSSLNCNPLYLIRSKLVTIIINQILMTLNYENTREGRRKRGTAPIPSEEADNSYQKTIFL